MPFVPVQHHRKEMSEKCNFQWGKKAEFLYVNVKLLLLLQQTQKGKYISDFQTRTEKIYVLGFSKTEI
jgi:hypothetical protein